MKDQPAAFTSEDAMWEYKYNELKALYEQMCQANEDLIQKNNKLKVDHQPTLEVGEYYKCSDIIYRVTSVGGSQIKYAKFYSEANKFYSESSASLNSNFCDNSKPATAEEIFIFKRAEHFASKGREWSEFKKGDIVQNTKTMQLGLVESVDEDGDALVNYNIDEPLIYPSCCKCTAALFLNLIQTAEELREVENNE